MKFSRIIKITAFFLAFIIIFFSVQNILAGDSDTRDYKRISGFFAQEENSLDAVFLGSSATYAFWSAPIAFARYGITVYPFSNSAQPIFAAKYMIDDARKKQPDAVYIVNITHILQQYDYYLHKLIDNYPLTLNKLRMTDYLCDIAGFSLSQRMEYYFPIIRFHGRWSELHFSDFFKQEDQYKAGNDYKSFLKRSKDIAEPSPDFNHYEKLQQYVIDSLNELMDYSEKENVKLLFVIMPQKVSKERVGNQNSMKKLIEERSFTVIDMRTLIEETGLDFGVDFYNERHTNIHGSIKITEYISEYLIENYGFKDKRGNEAYSDWDSAAERYLSFTAEYLTEGEKEKLGIKE